MDWLQQMHIVCNHEARHAVAHHRYGVPLVEIDVNHPDQFAEGWVVPARSTDLMMPACGLTGTDALRWIDENMERRALDRAVCARVGVGHEDWLGTSAKTDRDIVSRLCPPWMVPTYWELRVSDEAARLLEDERFNAAVRALSCELFHSRHEKMSGRRAFEIIERALSE